jgi:hypothetical protein
MNVFQKWGCVVQENLGHTPFNIFFFFWERAVTAGDEWAWHLFASGPGDGWSSKAHDYLEAATLSVPLS